MIITRVASALLVGVLGVALAIQPVFASGPPTAANGLVVITSSVTTSVTHADGNTIIEGNDRAIINGTFTGLNVAHFTLIIHPDGSFNDHEIGVFTGKAGTCGTGNVPFNAVIGGEPGASPQGSVASMNQAANTANIVFEAKLTGTKAGTVYSGTYHCIS